MLFEGTAVTLVPVKPNNGGLDKKDRDCSSFKPIQARYLVRS